MQFLMLSISRTIEAIAEFYDLLLKQKEKDPKMKTKRCILYNENYSELLPPKLFQNLNSSKNLLYMLKSFYAFLFLEDFIVSQMEISLAIELERFLSMDLDYFRLAHLLMYCNLY